MKNVLILSCNTGQGHNSCARAIGEALEARNVPFQIQDALEFISDRFSRFICGWHVRIYRYLPWSFRMGYRFSETHPGILRKESPIYKLLVSGVGRMREFVRTGGFDTVICTHVFPAVALSQIQKEDPLPIRTAFVATDYTCSPGVNLAELDHIFIPGETLREEFLQKGVCASRLETSGIPVSREFYRPVSREDAKRLVGVRPDSVHLLVMCGSMGCGPISRILGKLCRKMEDNEEITVICGTNRRLERRLKRRYGRERVHIIGYTRDMPLYAASADLYLTKPGGISVTEAAERGLPMVFINAVDGCERYNREFFVTRGGAVTASSPGSLAGECLRLLRDGEARAKMTAALEKCRCRDSGEVICRVMAEDESIDYKTCG